MNAEACPYPQLTHQVGEIVSVKAWWTGLGQTRRCKVEKVVQPFKSGGWWSGFYDVRPEGNPGAHSRMVKPDDVL